MEPREQILEVQSVLDRLTRFRHINGWAAVAAGLLSTLAYAFVCYYYNINWLVDDVPRFAAVGQMEIIQYTIAMGTLLIVAGLLSGIIVLSSLPRDLTRYAWRNLLKLIAVYSVYIICGGALVWAYLSSREIITYGILQSIPPMMCLLYGLAQFQAAYISLPSLKYLGAWMILCGIVGCFVPVLSWFLWMMGFGPGHIAIGFYVIKNRGN